MIISTTKGSMDDSFLNRVEGKLDNEDEITTWTEYYLGVELVHRSVHITLKKPAVFCVAAIAAF